MAFAVPCGLSLALTFVIYHSRPLGHQASSTLFSLFFPYMTKDFPLAIHSTWAAGPFTSSGNS